MKKVIVVILWIIVVLAAVIAAVLVIAPPVAKNYVNKHGQELIGRRISVDKLRVNPLSGRLRVCDLRVYEDDGSTLFVGFDTLAVRMKTFKLLKKEIHISHLSLTGLEATVIQNGGNFNFTSVIDFFNSKKDTTEVKAPKDTSRSGWAFAFYDIRFSGWKLHYSDLMRKSQWNLQNIGVRIPGVYFSGDRNTDAGIGLSFSDGGELNTRLDYNITSGEFNLNLDLKRFSLSNIQAYIADYLNIQSIHGDFSADLLARGNLSELMKTAISGTASIDGLELTDSESDEILFVKNLSVEADDINIDSSLFALSSISIDSLRAHYDNHGDYTNISRLLKNQSKADSAAVKDTAELVGSKSLAFSLLSFRMTHSSLTYNDFSMTDEFSLPITDIEIRSDDITLSGMNKAKLNATIANGGKIALLWNGTIDNLKENQHLVLNIKDFHLSEISPYSVEYLAQPFTNGTLSFTSDNTILNSALNGKNTLKLINPEVGSRRSDVDSAKRLPLKAALFILKDINGEVNIDAPVSGNIDNPEFSYMKIVWKTLRNLVVKIAASPFRAIGQALGFDADKLDFLDVDLLQTSLSSDQLAILDQIAKMATYNDGGVNVTLTQEIPLDSEEMILTLAQKRDNEVRDYLISQGVSAENLTVATRTISKSDSSKAGYKIESTLDD